MATAGIGGCRSDGSVAPSASTRHRARGDCRREEVAPPQMESARSSHAPPSPPATAGPRSNRLGRTTLSRAPRTGPKSRAEVPGQYYRRVHADQGFSVRAPGGPLRVLLVIKCLGYGGAERLLVDMVAVGDRHRFDYDVAYVLRDLDALVPSVVEGGTPV